MMMRICCCWYFCITSTMECTACGPCVHLFVSTITAETNQLTVIFCMCTGHDRSLLELKVKVSVKGQCKYVCYCNVPWILIDGRSMHVQDGSHGRPSLRDWGQWQRPVCVGVVMWSVWREFSIDGSNLVLYCCCLQYGKERSWCCRRDYGVSRHWLLRDFCTWPWCRDA